MMGLAIVLCLCSEADAFVAASFVTLRPSAKVAFLVLGPMIDFKLYFMYTRIFRPRLIFTIYVAVIVQVFLYSLATHYFWEKYAEKLTHRPPARHALGDQREGPRGDGRRRRAGFGLFAGCRRTGRRPPRSSRRSASGCINTNEDIPEVRFTQLENASSTQDLRDLLPGPARRSSSAGSSATSRRSRCLRYTINCCAADAQPIRVAIVVDPSVGTLPANQLKDKWVRVIGRGASSTEYQGEWRTALLIKPQPGETLVRTEGSGDSKRRWGAHRARSAPRQTRSSIEAW